MPGIISVSLALLTNSFPRYPIIPVGIVDTITRSANFLYAVLITLMYSTGSFLFLLLKNL